MKPVNLINLTFQPIRVRCMPPDWEPKVVKGAPIEPPPDAEAVEVPVYPLRTPTMFMGSYPLFKPAPGPGYQIYDRKGMDFTDVCRLIHAERSEDRDTLVIVGPEVALCVLARYAELLTTQEPGGFLVEVADELTALGQMVTLRGTLADVNQDALLVYVVPMALQRWASREGEREVHSMVTRIILAADGVWRAVGATRDRAVDPENP